MFNYDAYASVSAQFFSENTEYIWKQQRNIWNFLMSKKHNIFNYDAYASIFAQFCSENTEYLWWQK